MIKRFYNINIIYRTIYFLSKKYEITSLLKPYIDFSSYEVHTMSRKWLVGFMSNFITQVYGSISQYITGVILRSDRKIPQQFLKCPNTATFSFKTKTLVDYESVIIPNKNIDVWKRKYNVSTEHYTDQLSLSFYYSSLY